MKDNYHTLQEKKTESIKLSKKNAITSMFKIIPRIKGKINSMK